MSLCRLQRLLFVFCSLLVLIAAPASASVTLTDLENRTVTVKDAPERIVVGNYILNFLMVGGAESLKKVVALPQDGWQTTRFGEYAALTKSFPEIKTIPSIGGYHETFSTLKRSCRSSPIWY